MSWIQRTTQRARHALHLDEPTVTDDDRAELEHLREVTAVASDRAMNQAVEAHRLATFFKGQSDRNHIAERLQMAIQRGSRHA